MTNQFVLNALATGFILDPSSPDSGQIGTTIDGLPVWSAYQTAAHIARPSGTWTDYAPGMRVSYSFNVGATTLPEGYEAFTTLESQAGAIRAMQLYADVSGLTFYESADVNVSHINFMHEIGSANGGGWSVYPSAGGGNHVNVGHVPWEVGMEAGSYALNLMLHEVGHAMGLAHPGNYNGSVSVHSDADHYNDSGQYTNMSYWNETVTGANFSDLATLGLHDILAIQMEYGANWATRATNTVYGFNTNAGINSYDFDYDNTMAFSIWDGGGEDALDFSGFNSNSVMDLRQGAFSSSGLETYNVSIAYGAVIENAIGGSGDDRMLGNTSANQLVGGRGADVIFGGSETNAVVATDPRDFLGIQINDGPLLRDQYLNGGKVTAFSKGAFTLEMMIELTRSPGSMIPFASCAAAGSADEVLVHGVNDSFVKVSIGNVEYTTTIQTNSLIDGNPHRLSVSWDKATGALNTYVDGALADTGVLQMGFNIRSGGTLVFGQDQDSVGGTFATRQVLQGTIGDIRIFNDVRSAQEIAENAFVALTGGEQSLVHNWQVQVNDALTVTDVATANPSVNLTDLMPTIFTATQSSNYNGTSLATKILDNDTATANHTLNGGNEWVLLSFNQPLNIDRVEIINRTDSWGNRLNGATVSMLDAQGAVLFTSAPITGAGTGGTVPITLPDLLLAGAVRINHTTNYLHIAELNVFGTPPVGVDVPAELTNTDITIVNGGMVHDTTDIALLALDNDTLQGGEGNDALYGGAGNDMLLGDGSKPVDGPIFASLHGVELNAGTISNQYAAASNYAGLSGAANAVQFTIEMLVKVSRLPGTEIDFFSYANSQTSNAIDLGGYSNGNLYLTYRNVDQDIPVETSVLADGKEHRLSLTWDGRPGGGYIIYVDGVQIYSGTHPSQASSLNAGGTLIFGQEQDSVGGGFQSSQILPGTIADIRVFNDVRTPEEIAANAFTTLADPLTTQGLVSNWQVSSSTTTSIADARGGSALVLFGAPSVALFGNWDDDQLTGGIGNDVLVGGNGTDTAIFASDGAILVNYNSVSRAYTINAGADGIDVISGVENFQFTTGTVVAASLIITAANQVTGDETANTQSGTNGMDLHQGHDGDDVFVSSWGADQIEGGEGLDTAYYYASTDSVTVNLATGLGSSGDAAGDSYSSIEYVIGSNTAGDALTGDGVLNYLAGFGGDDVIDGGGVSEANVNLTTYQGDSLDGGAGTDTLSYATAAQRVIVLLDWNGPTAGIAWNGTSGDSMLNFENLTGSAHNDVLLGSDAANMINGGAGQDSLYGKLGADTFHFDALQLDGIHDFQDGTDKLSFSSATADSFSDFQIFGNGGTDYLAVQLISDGSLIVLKGAGTSTVTLTADDFVFV
jgi:Ca2+-binding RTX toxin-like protein